VGDTGGTFPYSAVLIVNGTQGVSPVRVIGRLGGVGVVGPLTLEGGSLLGGGPGSVRPGTETQAGTLHVQGDAHLRGGEAGNLVTFRLNGPTDHDALQATGTVFLDSSVGPFGPTRPTLTLSLGGFVPAIGQSFTLVGSDTGVTGTFGNGADGAVFGSGCLSFRINYTATTVTVTRVAGAYEPFARFYTVPACRVVDTRGPTGPTGGPALVPGYVRFFPIAGACQIPATAKALSANVTAVGPESAGDLRVFPVGMPPPLASVLNFGAGQARANNLVVGWACSPDKSLAIQNESTGAVHVILDVNGYFE
jgi:hypothetical protein